MSVAGPDVLKALVLHRRDLTWSKFDLVMANNKSTVLSVSQLDMTIRYRNAEEAVTVIFGPELAGLLLSRVDCITLDILHRDYPRPIDQTLAVS